MHAVRPGETYDTKKHNNLGAIDGILLKDGSIYKTNNGNGNAKFSVFSKIGPTLDAAVIIPEVIPDEIGTNVNRVGDILKDANNLAEKFKPLKKLFKLSISEHSGMYKRGDGSTVGSQWWNDAKKIMELTDNDLSRESWNTTLAKFRQDNPEGLPE
ncbi:hypothetical protein FACS1894130_12200 [Spirochaetia bacterium]|nr:hypothetical protein FACS1894130_12200 [Spirochaetia bacterium]